VPSLTVALLATLVMTLLFLIVLSILLWRLVTEQRKTAESHDKLMSKTVALLASKNLESYQGIQVVETPSFNSSESEDSDFGEAISDAEADALFNKYQRGEELNDREQAQFDRIFVSMGG
jgi:Tfp pilus assembly protein PilX